MKPLDPRLLRHAMAARRFVVLAAGIGVATGALVIVQAELLAGVIDDAFLGGAGLDALAVPLLVLLAVVSGRAVLAWGGETAAHRASAEVVRQLRGKLIDHVLRLGPRDPDGPSRAEVATLATRGLDGLDGYFGRYLPTLLIAAVVPAMVAGRILFADWVSGLIVGLTVPLIPLFMVLIGLHTEPATRRQWRTLSYLGHHFVDIVAGLDTLVAFGRARRQAGRLRELAESYRATTMRTLRVAFLSALVLELLATLSVALIAVSVGLRLLDGRLDLATALLVLILAPEVYLPLRAVGARFHDSAEGRAAADDLFRVLDTPDGVSGRTTPPDPSAVPVRLDGVGVAGRSGRVLDGLSLTLAPGEVLGVVGPSGSGKSTLLDLLLAFRRPDAGSIEVGGVALRDVDPQDWRRRIAWVPQRPVLLVGTVADNIRLGAPRADDTALHRAAAAAALDVPLDAPVGETGAGLSTGQQRRVALARALAADRPLLLLDEPTEGVDGRTEAAILAALPDAFAGRTVVLVTHRPAALGLCDRVVKLPGRSAPPTRASDPSPAQPVPPAAVDRTEPTVPATDGQPARPAGAVRWLLGAARTEHARLALAVLLGSAALASGVALTATSAYLISAAALHPPVLALMVAIVAVRTFGLSKGVFRYAERLVSHDATLRVLTALRLRIWSALVRLGPAATGRLRRGDLLSRLISDVEAQQDVLTRAVIPAASAAVVGAGVCIGLGLLLPAAGVLAAVGLVLGGLAAPALAVLAARSTERRTAAARGTVLAHTVELLDAVPDLLAFDAAARYRRLVADADDRLGALLRRSAWARGLGSALGVLAIGATSVALAATGIAAVRAGELAGVLLAVLALTPLAAAELVAGLPDAALRLAAGAPATRRLAELESLPSPVREPAAPAGVRPAHDLVAEDLAVRWPGADHDAVTGVNLALHAGGRVALVGPSGAGKSSVVAALMRTLDPSAGVVLADGRDARGLTGDELRDGIAWCGSNTHIFDSTLRHNLLLARPDAGETELGDALRRARLADWVAGLPDGLDTPLGRHGGAVSGGERQRIGVARAMLADRPVLLLDEPTAHLDASTAAAMATELLEATAGRTALVVTHRPEQVPDLPVVEIAAARVTR